MKEKKSDMEKGSSQAGGSSDLKERVTVLRRKLSTQPSRSDGPYPFGSHDNWSEWTNWNEWTQFGNTF